MAPLLATKLAVPTLRSALVPRPRLMARLEGTGAERLTLVVAPPGWGKSTLLCEWLAGDAARRARSTGWVSLDAGDNDPARFLHYAIAALDGACPGVGDAARGLLQSPQPPPLEVILSTLLNEINAAAVSLTLILDDYHVIEAQPVHDAVLFLLDHLPPNLRLILATRADPPLPLSRLRVRGQLLELRASDLCFTDSETAAFLNEVMGLGLGAEEIASLEARTEGWIAGLQLAALSLRSRQDRTAFIGAFSGSHRHIVDYLVEEVLARQPERVQAFLLQTAVLNRLCAPLCDAVTGRTDGQALLEHLEAANLFLIQLDDERQWFRYHHLFANVLRARLAQEPSAAGGVGGAALHRRAAAWYEQNAMAEEAVSHALAAQDWERVVRLAEQEGEALWMRGGQHTLDGWLRALPGDLLRSRPRLCVLQASLYLFNLRMDAAETFFKSVDFRAPDDDAGRDVHGQWLALQAYLVRLQGEPTRAVALSHEAFARLSPSNAVWRSATNRVLGMAYFECGDLAAADEAFAAAVVQSQEADFLHSTLMVLAAHGQLREAQGALREAAALYHRILDEASAHKVPNTPETIFGFAGLGRLCYENNDLDGALIHLRQGLERRHPAFIMFCYVELLRVKQAQGDQDGLAALLEQMEQVARTTRFAWFHALVAAMRARTHSAQHDVAAAWLREFEERATDGAVGAFPSLDIRAVEEMTWARVCLALSRIDPVITHLHQLLETATVQGRAGSAMEIRALLATAHQRAGDHDRALSVLLPALALAEKEGYVRVFLDAGPAMVSVLRHAAAKGCETEYVAKLLAAFGEEALARAAQKAPAASSPECPLSEREIEVLRLVAVGLSNPQIAEQLYLSVGTIKRHVYNIYSKLDAKGRIDAVTRARDLNLL